MKKTGLEQQFEQEILQKGDAARKKCGYDPTRLLRLVSRQGGVGFVKALIRKGGVSDSLPLLQAAGRLDLSLEATVVQTKYAALFTDEEVDHCLALLCEAGYYRTD